MILAAVLAAALAAAPAPAAALAPSAAQGPAATAARRAALLDAVEPARLQETVAGLVAFGTRHTLSDTASQTRGIGAARRWLAARAAALAGAPGSRLLPFEDRFTQPEAPPRVARPVEIWNVGVRLPGADPRRAGEAIVLTAHYDSRATDVMDAAGDAPGANDDGSGVAVILELARVLAGERPAVTVYFVAVAGEEQGLHGSVHLARRLAAEGVRVLAMASVDTVGNVEGQDGVRDDVTLRVFSEGVPAVEGEAARKLREAIGGENDSAAREWARYLRRAAAARVENLDVQVMLRRDRIARGSDHLAFSREGVAAVRLTEGHEHYGRQHQDPRVEGGMAYGDDLAHFDARYAAKVARGLLAAVAELAAAPAPLRELALGGAVSPDTRLRWTLPDDPRVAGVVVYRRRADAVAWQRADRHPAGEPLVLRNLVPDSHVFAVATVDAEGNESLPIYPTRLE